MLHSQTKCSHLAVRCHRPVDVTFTENAILAATATPENKNGRTGVVKEQGDVYRVLLRFRDDPAEETLSIFW